MKYPSLFTTSSREYLSMLERVNKLTEIYPIENLKLMMIVLNFECRPNLVPEDSVRPEALNFPTLTGLKGTQTDFMNINFNIRMKV